MPAAAATQWPTYTAYREALQNPRNCFRESQLQAGTAVKGRLGPVVYSGNFGCVFKLKVPPSATRGVKCFTRFLGDRQPRYRAITQYLASHPAPAMMAFEFRPDGLMVLGQSYPFLLMEWVGGRTLDAHLEAMLSNAQTAAIRDLAGAFRGLVADLESRGVAHGDLQHGNIIVGDAGLRLVDLDGMFVPGLKGLGAPEVGMPAYQHPKRDLTVFGPALDRFSALVIYTSLLALAEEPAVWALHNDDLSLLFKKEDYRNPAASAAFRRLRAVKGEVARLVGVLEQACVRPIGDVPALSTLVSAPAAISAARPAAGFKVVLSDLSGDPVSELDCAMSAAASGGASGQAVFRVANQGTYPVRMTVRSAAGWLRLLSPASLSLPPRSSYEVRLEAVVPALRGAPMSADVGVTFSSWLPGQRLDRIVTVRVPLPPQPAVPSSSPGAVAVIATPRAPAPVTAPPVAAAALAPSPASASMAGLSAADAALLASPDAEARWKAAHPTPPPGPINWKHLFRSTLLVLGVLLLMVGVPVVAMGVFRYGLDWPPFVTGVVMTVAGAVLVRAGRQALKGRWRQFPGV